MTTLFSLKSLALGASVLLLTAAAGCENGRPGAGFTNPGPGSTSARDKASSRTDLPVPDLNADHKEPIAETGASSPSATGTNAGAGGPGGGQRGANGDARQVSPEATSSAPASPPRKDNAGSAAGDTKPADKINTGTPRGPQ